MIKQFSIGRRYGRVVMNKFILVTATAQSNLVYDLKSIEFFDCFHSSILPVHMRKTRKYYIMDENDYHKLAIDRWLAYHLILRSSLGKISIGVYTNYTITDRAKRSIDRKLKRLLNWENVANNEY